MDEAPESLSSSISPSDGEVPLILPNGITTNGEYTILVQIDPEDTLDFTGATGAVGRFEVEDEEGTVPFSDVHSFASQGRWSLIDL